MTLDVLPAGYAVCRLDPDAAVPAWAHTGAFSSITRTQAELSIVCAENDVPPDVTAERGFRALTVRGPLDFGLVGVVASLSAAIAAAGVSLFVVSTYDTDYLLVRGAALERAVDALRGAGHAVVSAA